MLSYYVIYKPFNVLSQFSAVDAKQTLADYFTVEKDVYPVGRLDYDSEGLLILTNDTSLNHRLLNPKFAHDREYWVQVDGQITAEAIIQLQKGVNISMDGKIHPTLPCKAILFDSEPLVPERNPPVRFRKNIPTSWLRLVLTEGKNRQVRKMTAAVGFPTLRLIRAGIEKISLGQMQPGEIVQLPKEHIYKILNLSRS